jgi:uncharacterized protein YbjT (DUF2867 family)
VADGRRHVAKIYNKVYFLASYIYFFLTTHHRTMTTFLIVGATGKQGGRAISTLFDQQATNKDISLRFITRNTESASAKKLEGKGAKTYKADLFDKESLRQALTGVDRAFLVTDAMAGEEKEAQQGKTFIDVAKEVGVKHIVFTSVSASDTATTVPHFRSKYEVSYCSVDAKALLNRQVEKYLAASGLSYTILRPVAFMVSLLCFSNVRELIG